VGAKRKWIDREIARLLADVQIAPPKIRERLEAAADVEDEGQRRVFLRILQDEVAEDNFLPEPVIPRMSVCATSPLCRLRKVRRGIVGFKHRKVFGAEMGVDAFRPAGS
jgi:hypothetical protein